MFCIHFTVTVKSNFSILVPFHRIKNDKKNVTKKCHFVPKREKSLLSDFRFANVNCIDSSSNGNVWSWAFIEMFNHQWYDWAGGKKGRGENKHSLTLRSRWGSGTGREWDRERAMHSSIRAAKARLIFIFFAIHVCMLHVCCPVVIASCWPIV